MKTALVARFGVIGDQLITAQILPHLKRQGYHVTFMGYKPFTEIHRNNPNIDVLRELERDALGSPTEFFDYWKTAGRTYDRVIHLSESLERLLCFFEDQMQFWWEDTARRALANHSYLERTMDLAGVPHEFTKDVFFPTEEEMAFAGNYVNEDGPTIGLVLAGSALDKVHPKIQSLAANILASNQDARIVLFAGPTDRDKQLVELCLKSIKDHTPYGIGRVRHTLGFSIRQSLSVAKRVDVLVGPDTGMMWGVALDPAVAKVVMLSHASPTNITKHWVRTETFHADQDEVSCWPCHRLHRRSETCRLDKATGAAACISSIAVDAVARTALSLIDKE